MGYPSLSWGRAGEGELVAVQIADAGGWLRSVTCGSLAENGIVMVPEFKDHASSGEGGTMRFDGVFGKAARSVLSVVLAAGLCPASALAAERGGLS